MSLSKAVNWWSDNGDGVVCKRRGERERAPSLERVLEVAVDPRSGTECSWGSSGSYSSMRLMSKDTVSSSRRYRRRRDSETPNPSFPQHVEWELGAPHHSDRIAIVVVTTMFEHLAVKSCLLNSSSYMGWSCSRPIRVEKISFTSCLWNCCDAKCRHMTSVDCIASFM